MMCAYDDDPSVREAARSLAVKSHQNDADPGYLVPGSTTCLTCGHGWHMHSTRAGAEILGKKGRDLVPCLSYVNERTPAVRICGCRELAPVCRRCGHVL